MEKNSSRGSYVQKFLNNHTSGETFSSPSNAQPNGTGCRWWFTPINGAYVIDWTFIQNNQEKQSMVGTPCLFELDIGVVDIGVVPVQKVLESITLFQLIGEYLVAKYRKS